MSFRQRLVCRFPEDWAVIPSSSTFCHPADDLNNVALERVFKYIYICISFMESLCTEAAYSEYQMPGTNGVVHLYALPMNSQRCLASCCWKQNPRWSWVWASNAILPSLYSSAYSSPLGFFLDIAALLHTPQSLSSEKLLGFQCLT